MEIVIRIPKEIYSHTQDYEVGGFNQENDTKLFMAIKNGTPLPEHHGRLGDLDKLEKEMNDYIKSIPLPYHEAERLVLLMNHFDDAPTIIEGSESK